MHQAGQNLKKHFGNIKYLRFKSEDPTDGVTKLDQETEKFIEKELKKLYPSIGFKGEEYGKRLESERFWLADPIDGTGYFVRGIPGCTTMIALIENGEIKFSIIHDFIFDNLYYAQEGQGAFLNKKRISQDPWGNDYDFAPRQLLVKEAGGVVANIGANSFNYKNLNFLAVKKSL